MRRIAATALAALVLAPTPAMASDRFKHSAQVRSAQHPTDKYAPITTTYSWGTIDEGGFDVGTCISYVAWYEKTQGRDVSLPAWWGTTEHLTESPPVGWIATTRPRRGDVILWFPDQMVIGRGGVAFASATGHVGIVTWVYKDHTVEVASYNGDGNKDWTPGRYYTSGHYLEASR